MSIASRLRLASLFVAFLGLALLTAPGTSAERLTSRPKPATAAVKPSAIGEEVRTGTGQRRRLVLPDGSILYVNQSASLKITANRGIKLSAGEVLVEAAPGKEPFVIDTPKRQVAALGTTFAVNATDRGTGVVVARGKVKVSDAGGKGEQLVTAGQRLSAEGDRPEASPRASHLLDWTRDLMVSAESPLVPASAHAGGSLTVLDPNGQEAKLNLRKYHVDVFIEDGFARTTIDQTYFNDTHSRLEGTFHFPLPPDASLSRLAMYVEGTRMEGGMVERDYGRNVYESIVTKQQDPALLEWVDSTTFKMRVFPLEARQEKRIILSYSQRLGSCAGQETYRFPAGHSLERVRDWSLHVRVKDGDKLAWNSPSHALKARPKKGDLFLDAAEKNAKLDCDVVLSLGLMQSGEQMRFSTMEHGGAKYLMVRHRPGVLQRGEPGRAARDMVILFESSGDRDPLLARTQVEIVRGLLHNTEPDDTFAVLTAGTRTRSPMKERQRATPENIQQALAFLENAHLIGALDLGHGLSDASALLKDGRNPHLIHVGSGIAAMGEQRQDVLVKSIPEGVRYVGIGVGRRWNRNFMKSAAEKTGGLFTQINPDEPISWRSFELASILNSPRLLDVSVSDDSGKNRWLTVTSLLAQGEEVCAVTRLETKDLPETVSVRARMSDRPVEMTLRVAGVAKDAAYLPRTWASLEIGRLLAEDGVKHKKEIVELSKTTYVMSPFTSLLVLENEAMYEQYKVDRGRKDHWALYDCPDKIGVFQEDEDGNRIDSKKAGKPGVKQVLDTILIRAAPRVLDMGEVRGSAPPVPGRRIGVVNFIATRRPDDREPLLPPVNIPTPRFIQDFSPKPASNILASLAQYDINGGDAGPARVSGGGFRASQLNDPAPAPLPDKPETPRTAILPVIRDRSGQPLSFDKLNVLERHLASLTGGGGTPDIQEQIAELLPSFDLGQFGRLGVSADTVLPRDSLYKRPAYSGEDRLFHDLVSYAPGMNSSRADILTILEAESVSMPGNRLGRISPEARKLFEQAQRPGWQRFEIPKEGDNPAFVVVFDGQGRHVWERTLPPGIRERVVCDGDSLWHLYPGLGLGAKRSASRFHRLDFTRLVPLAVPKPEDVARGADMVLIGERTAALVPHGAGERKDDKSKPLPFVQKHFLFDAHGQYVEQQLVEMPAKKVLRRLVLSPRGAQLLDENGKELAAVKGKLDAGDRPNLKPDLKVLAVLALPYRTREHIVETRKLKGSRNESLTFEDAFALLGAEFAGGSVERLTSLFKESFHGRGRRELGLYVLLAAAGLNLDAQSLDVLSEHHNEPLAQYLALHSSPVLRKHASQWAAGSVQWGDGFLRPLAVAHAMLQRWQNPRVLDSTKKQRADALASALDFAAKNSNSEFGFALLGLMADRAGESEEAGKDVKDVRAALARAWENCLQTPGLEGAARYEHARALWQAGKRDEGRKGFLALYASARERGGLPLVDEAFRQALQGGREEKDEWNALMRSTARELIAKKQRAAVLSLAWDCSALDDQPMAQDLLAAALDGVKDRKERLTLALGAVLLHMHHQQTMEAERLLQPLLDDGEWTNHAELWRLAVMLSSRRNRTGREMECFERALHLEYLNPPEVRNLRDIDHDYVRLLDHYQRLADAMVTLKVKPPEDFLAKVVRTADRWRSLSGRGTDACEKVAEVLQQLGEQELAWDYLTTPLGQRPGESEPWVRLARTLRDQSDLKRADEAFASAFAAEPTNAQILWDRAQNLRQAGNAVESKKLLRQLADGTWQPRFQALAAQARWQLEER